MSEVKPFLGPPAEHPELDQLLKKVHGRPVTEQQLQEQRVSFAFGNAPKGSGITKESARTASESILIDRH